MDEALLREECGQCAALCCVSLSFEQSTLFAIDKDAGTACPNLADNARCAIHNRLEPKGFAGCVRYTCLGAGQRVTQELFDGRTWQQDGSLLGPMMEAFRLMRQVHELLQLLIEADKLALDPPEQRQLDQLAQALQPQQGWTIPALEKFENGPVGENIRTFLKSLRAHITIQRN